MKAEKIICFIIISCLLSIYCSAQNDTRQSSQFGVGIAITPNYDYLTPLNFNAHLLRPSLKEYQLLFSTDLKIPTEYFRIEGGINWYLSKKNKTRRIQLFPSTSIAYIYHYPQNRYKENMMFVSLGINTNIRVYKGWFITGRIQEGWGQEFESPDHLTNNIADQTVYNEFYYVGIKYLFNYK